jgi:glycosyltransferase involved in cell wall biosynthesis
MAGAAPRVLHVTQTTITGTARVVADLARSQQEAGWDIRVASPAGEPLVGWLRDAGVPHLRWEATRAPGPATAAEVVRLDRIVRGTAPDLLHLHSSKAGLAGRAAVRGSRATIFQPHAWSFAAVGGAARRATIAWERAAARWADVVLCVSEGERRRGEQAGVAGRYRVVPNGVDLARFGAGDSAARDDARRRLGLDPGPLAVCVGRLSRQKGQDLLLAAWPAVRAAVPGARLALVGGGALEGTPPLPGDVLLAGDQPDVTPWLHAADVVVAPSRWEGMALGVLEAMATARSVVATDVDGMREAVGDDGAGALVPPEDAGALAGTVAVRLTDVARAEAEGAAGRLRVERWFDRERSLRETSALALEVLAARRRDLART